MTLLSEIYDVVHSNRDCCSPRATLAQNFMTNHDFSCDGQAPVANFSADVAAGNTPFTAQFINTSTGEITSYLWTFGDGTTSTEESPSHIYTSLGDHTVSLTVTGPNGSDTITRTDYIGVVIPPAAEFVADKTAGVGTLDVQFTDQSTGIILYYDWDFGDGTVASGERSVGSYEQNPTHTFTAPGTYTIKLKVTGSGTGDADEEIKTDYIKISVDPPVANFVANKTVGGVTTSIQFTGHTVGTITGYLWNFGDGTTSTVLSPSHTYTAAGTYTVSFTATGPGGSDVETKTNFITISAAPVAAFTSDKTSGDIPLTVQFTNQSTGTITSRLWNFGDGTTSTLLNPSHLYSTNGVYTVSLTTTGPGGQDVETKTNFISANATIVIPYDAASKYIQENSTNGTDMVDNDKVQLYNALSGIFTPIKWSTNRKSPGITLHDDDFRAEFSANYTGIVAATTGFSSGKHYWEVTVSFTSSASDFSIGVCSEEGLSLAGVTYPSGTPGSYPHSYGAYIDGRTFANSTNSSGLTISSVNIANAILNGAVLGVVLDCDNWTIQYIIYNVAGTEAVLSQPTTITSGKTYLPSIGVNALYYNTNFKLNFGQEPMVYAPPAGFPAGSSAYTTTQPYYITTSDQSNVNVASMTVINSANIIATEPANTTIKGLVSFDGRNTWKKWNGIEWRTWPLTDIGEKGVLFIDGEGVIEDETGLNTVTVNGAPTISTSVKRYGNSSIHFNGAGDSLLIPHNSNFNFGGDDFTIDFWFNADSSVNGQVLLCRTQIGGNGFGPFIFYVDSGNLQLYLSSNGYSFDICPGNVITTLYVNTWTHVAVTRSYDTFYMFSNGSLIGEFDIPGAVLYNCTYPVNVARRSYALSDDYFPGYIDNLRLVKGRALWTNDFSVDTDLQYEVSDGLQSGNTVIEIEDGLTNLNITNEASLDFMFDLATTSSAVTPVIDDIVISYK